MGDADQIAFSGIGEVIAAAGSRPQVFYLIVKDNGLKFLAMQQTLSKGAFRIKFSSMVRA